MQRDVKTLYTVVISHAVALLLVAFVSDPTLSRWLLTLVSVGGALSAYFLIKKRSELHLRRHEATVVCVLSALLGVMAYLLTGLQFGFYKPYMEDGVLFGRILPTVCVIVAGEILRRILLSQQKRAVTVLSYLSLALTEVMLFTERNPFSGRAVFVSTVALVLLPALSSGLLYTYLSRRHGALCVIPYRLILALYPYLIPIESGIPGAMLAFARIALPLLLLGFVRALYEKKKKTTNRYRRAANIAATAVCLLIMTVTVCFVSGIFGVKMIVVGSESMEDAIMCGDVVVYEVYEGQTIEKGQVILFERGDTIVIHRVVDIQKINGVYRYFTKGDANDGLDTGYITQADIVGITTMKIRYIGYPTVWLHDIFQ
ncbi:MAG: signal peptidase I [Clostridia bacterium]|nr:signal peptidase I [Clostridia bacterium]MBQ9785695.1 signal peptidase I [Clostridia bacterium]